MATEDVVMVCACGIRRKWKAGRDIPEGDVDCVCGKVMQPAGVDVMSAEEANAIKLLGFGQADVTTDTSPEYGGLSREGTFTGDLPLGPVLYDERESLLCVLTVTEFMNRSSALARAVQDVKSEQDHQTEQKAKMKSVLTEFEGERDRLTMAVSRKAEPRDIRVMGKPDYAAGLLRFYRIDTGEEIRSRSLTESERQRPLFSEED